MDLRKCSLLMRRLSVGAVFALSALLAGCVVETADPVDDLGEEVAEAESQLDPYAQEKDVTPGEDKKDPDPNPWRWTEESDPGPHPDSLVEHVPSKGHGNDE
jgi:outer membrane murein-binding lipoprotein Lpp